MESWNTCLKSCKSSVTKKESHWLECLNNSKKIKKSGESENVLDSNWIESYRFTNLRRYFSTSYQFCLSSAQTMCLLSENKLPEKWEHFIRNWEDRKVWWSAYCRAWRHSEHQLNLPRDRRTCYTKIDFW